MYGGTITTGVKTQYRLLQEFLLWCDGFEKLLVMGEERWKTFGDTPLYQCLNIRLSKRLSRTKHLLLKRDKNPAVILSNPQEIRRL